MSILYAELWELEPRGEGFVFLEYVRKSMHRRFPRWRDTGEFEKMLKLWHLTRLGVHYGNATCVKCYIQSFKQGVKNHHQGKETSSGLRDGNCRSPKKELNTEVHVVVDARRIPASMCETEVIYGKHMSVRTCYAVQQLS